MLGFPALKPLYLSLLSLQVPCARHSNVCEILLGLQEAGHSRYFPRASQQLARALPQGSQPFSLSSGEM